MQNNCNGGHPSASIAILAQDKGGLTVGLTSQSGPLAATGSRYQGLTQEKKRQIMEMMRTPPTNWDDLHFALNPAAYMYLACLEKGKDWCVGDIRPYYPIHLEPAACMLNYSQGLFEGVKAQRTQQGEIVLFRPDWNAEQMNQGAVQLGMTPVPEDMVVDAIKAVIAANVDWIPPNGKGSLYIRPLLFESGGVLGVQTAPFYTFLVYANPGGPYFKGGLSTHCIESV